jgi:hypothetical protein
LLKVLGVGERRTSMFLVQKFDDGSFSVGYETGDKAPLKEDFHHRDLDNRTYKTTPKGSIVTIMGRYHGDPVVGNWSIAFYNVKFTNGWRESMMFGSRFDTTKVDPETLKKGEPTLYFVPWHEGNLWKCAKVVAWSAKEARAKWIKSVGDKWGQERVQGAKFGRVYTKAKGNECWIGIVTV